MWTAGVAWLMAGLVNAGPVAPRGGGPWLSEAQLFAMLDLTRPELADVAAREKAGDRAGAKHALASHFRTRTTPHWFEPLGVKTHRTPSVAERKRADEALAHIMTAQDLPYQFGPTIDWFFNATTAPGSNRFPTSEWTNEFNRHGEWTAMAHVYRDTGDEKYALEFAKQMRSSIERCPCPNERGQYSPSAWRTIETGIRASESWPEVWNQFVASPSLSDDDVLLFLRAYIDHARHLMAFHAAGNWLTMEAAGLYTVGALFPEFKDAPQWRDTAAGWAYSQMLAQVYPDGVQFELSSGYHWVSLSHFLIVYKVAAINGYPLPSDYLRRLESMYNYLVYGAMPDRNLPAVQDSADFDVRAPLAEAYRFYPSRHDFQWFGSNGKAGCAPRQTSYEFPYAGYLFMRSGWERDACALMFDVGPCGAGHQHEDKLAIILQAYGSRLLVDPGVYLYEASKWRNLFIDSASHNVVLVDGQPQRRRGNAPECVVKTHCPHFWETAPDHDYAEGYFTAPYAQPVGTNVSQTRRILYLKPDLWFVLDTFVAKDAAEHTYDTLFHFAPLEARADGLSATTVDPAGPNLQVVARPDAGMTLSIVKGQDNPLQGWLPNADCHSVHPAPCAIFRQKGRGTVHALYVLSPSRQGEPARVTSVTALDGSGLGAVVALRGGRTIKVRFAEGGPNVLTLDGQKLTGRAVWSDGTTVKAAGGGAK